jgi:hypothetical protein
VARALAIWLMAMALGAVLVVVLPEDGRTPLFQLSPRHGPSGADMLGIAVALAGWTVFVIALAHRWWRLRPRLLAGVLLTAAVVGTVGCLAAVTADRDGLAALCALASILTQLGLAAWGIASDARRGNSARNSETGE